MSKTAHRPQLSEHTPMSRHDVETAGAIARLETTTGHLGEKLDAVNEALCDKIDKGFARGEKAFFEFGQTLSEINEALAGVVLRTQSLENTRKGQRTILRWVAGVVGTVVGAVILKVLIG